MTTRPDDALASLLLTQRLVEADARPFASKDYWRLIDLVGDPARLLREDPATVASESGLPAEWTTRVVGLLAAGTALAIELEALEQRGLDVITPFDDGYPSKLVERLGRAAPSIMYTAGPATLLSQASIAIVGSRNVSDEGARLAQQVAELAVNEGATVISGGAKGTDQLAMNAAVEAGGTVVGVLAEGLDRRLRQSDVRRAIGHGSVCLISPYKPTAGFSVGNAMARNKVVYALADTTLVVAADHGKGGTWEGAVEALRHTYGTVAVWTGPGAGNGNAALVDRGALPIDDPEQLFGNRPAAAPPAEQLRLA